MYTLTPRLLIALSPPLSIPAEPPSDTRRPWPIANRVVVVVEVLCGAAPHRIAARREHG